MRDPKYFRLVQLAIKTTGAQVDVPLQKWLFAQGREDLLRDMDSVDAGLLSQCTPLTKLSHLD